MFFVCAVPMVDPRTPIFYNIVKTLLKDRFSHNSPVKYAIPHFLGRQFQITTAGQEIWVKFDSFPFKRKSFCGRYFAHKCEPSCKEKWTSQGPKTLLKHRFWSQLGSLLCGKYFSGSQLLLLPRCPKCKSDLRAPYSKENNFVGKYFLTDELQPRRFIHISHFVV